MRTANQPVASRGAKSPSAAVHFPAKKASARVAMASVAYTRKPAAPDPAVHDGRLPFLQRFQQFVSPKEYAAKVLAGNKFAWVKIGLPGKDGLAIADLDAAKSIMASELQLGVGGDWPPTMRDMMGHSSVSNTTDGELHARLRRYMGMAFTEKAVQEMLPELQATVSTHLARWAAATSNSTSSTGSIANGSSTGDTAASSAQIVGLSTTADGSMVFSYPAVRMLTFDMLVNRVLGLGMGDGEVQQYAALFETLVDGFVPPAWDLPFTPYGKGLKARQQLKERIMQTLSSPQCSGVLARLRDEFGVDSPVAIDNTITLLFAGFDTTSSSLTFMLWLLAQHPDVLETVQAEQAEVIAAFGPTLRPEAYKAMPYTMAVIKETLRVAQIIAYVPRKTTRELPVPQGPTMSAGCPFFIALAAISKADPAIQAAGDGDAFRPDRWLEPGASKTLSQYQLPFGTGQRTCLGMNLAYAEMVAVLSELGRSYSLSADWQTEWKDFPIKRPDNGLPLRLVQRPAGVPAATAAPTRQLVTAAV